MLYLADVPTETLRIALPDGGVPAPAEPQYWHRAAGLDDTFIAQTESRHRVRFAREHVVVAIAAFAVNIDTNKNSARVYIISLDADYIKFCFALKVKNRSETEINKF